MNTSILDERGAKWNPYVVLFDRALLNKFSKPNGIPFTCVCLPGILRQFLTRLIIIFIKYGKINIFINIALMCSTPKVTLFLFELMLAKKKYLYTIHYMQITSYLMPGIHITEMPRKQQCFRNVTRLRRALRFSMECTFFCTSSTHLLHKSNKLDLCRDSQKPSAHMDA